jgi:hypothetical protein
MCMCTCYFQLSLIYDENYRLILTQGNMSLLYTIITIANIFSQHLMQPGRQTLALHDKGYRKGCN